MKKKSEFDPYSPFTKTDKARSGWGPITAVSIISTRRQIFSRFMQLTTAGTIA